MTNDLPSSPDTVPSPDTTAQTIHNSSVISILCRICYDGEKEEELISPCNCRGTVAFVHRSCLETWLGESNTTTCELCHQVFKTERSPRYTSTQSIWHWLRASHRNSQQGVRTDILACTIITPLAIVITYICLFSSEYYNQQKFSNVPAARWTSVSLLIMIAIMLTGYYLWVYSVIRMHARVWYSWWQRTCNVRYIPPSTIDISNADHANPLDIENSIDQTGSENEIAGALSSTDHQKVIRYIDSSNDVCSSSTDFSCSGDDIV